MQKTISSIIISLACATSMSVAYAEDLLSVYQQAKANDPVLLKSQAQYMAAKEDINIARASLMPNLRGTIDLGQAKTTIESATTQCKAMQFKAMRNYEKQPRQSRAKQTNAKQSQATQRKGKQRLIELLSE